MAAEYLVAQEQPLLAFLFASLPQWSKKSVKQRLQKSAILVNGTYITQHNYPLKKGDKVTVGNIVTITSTDKEKPSLKILYQDKDIIAIVKPAGLLSVGNQKNDEAHALSLLRKQLSKGRKNISLFPVHRLDKATSGVLLFATSKAMREAVMAQWSKAQKSYLAIVEGKVKEERGTINQPLRMDDTLYMTHVGEHPQAKKAITHYVRTKEGSSTTLLTVTIETGRQHQIRAHMAWLGHSIVGDERYGKRGKYLGLHASSLRIKHPRSKKTLCFQTPAPQLFYMLLR
jgi:23S rRNA pseudouridine1911/1915/1917 synthase